MGLAAGLNSFFWRFIHGSYEGASRRWKKAIFVLFLLFPGIGSGGSVWLFGMWFVAMLHWIFDPETRRLERDERWLIGVFAFYFLITAGFSIFHAVRVDAQTGFGSVYSNLPFLLIAPLFPVLRRAFRPGWTEAMFAGLACGAILALAIVMIGGSQSLALLRAGFSGNPLILALGGLISGLLCLHGALFYRGRMQVLLTAGMLAALVVLLFTGSRGPLLSFGLVIVIYAVVMGYRHFGLRWMFVRVAALVVLLGIGMGVVAQTDPYIAHRYDVLLERLSNPADESVGENGIIIRLALYRTGYQAFLDRPFTGYGRPNVMAAAQENGPQFPENYFSYSHLHNGYLTDLVSSGLFGLLSLLAVLIAPLIVFWRTAPIIFGAVLCVVCAYTFYGATNLLFYHDVSTLLFLSLIAVLGAIRGQLSGQTKR